MVVVVPPSWFQAAASLRPWAAPVIRFGATMGRGALVLGCSMLATIRLFPSAFGPAVADRAGVMSLACAAEPERALLSRLWPLVIAGAPANGVARPARPRALVLVSILSDTTSFLASFSARCEAYRSLMRCAASAFCDSISPFFLCVVCSVS